MTQKSYVTPEGEYLGTWVNGAPRVPAIEVPPRPVEGAVWSGGAWQLPPPPVPASLTFRQALIGLVEERWITEAEGEQWLVGTLPATVEAVIASLPAAERFAARVSAARPSVILRGNRLLADLAAARGLTDAEIDAFFITYAQV